MYAVETLRRLDALENLASEWSALCRLDPNATPFQTPEWVLSWWRHLGGGNLRCTAVRHGGELAGIAPLYVSKRQFPPLRRLAFLGTGRSDYLDVIAHPDHRAEVLERMLAAIWEARGEWDYLDLQQVAPDANAIGLIPLNVTNLFEHPHSVCPYLPLAGPDGMDHVPSRLRKNLRYSQRRLAQFGEVHFRLATSPTLDADLTTLFRLHRSRWRSRGLPGVFGSRAVQAFLRDAAAAYLKAGLLRLHVLERDGEPLAAALCYAMNGRTFYYGGGFDPEAAAFSPGSLVVAEAIRCAAVEGCVEFDFLRGEEAYKRLWGCRVRRNQRLIAASSAGAARIVNRLPALEARLERAGLRALERYQRWRR